MSKNKIHTGSVIPGLEVEVFEHGMKTLMNTGKESHQFTIGITLKRDLGNLAAKLVLYKFCKELEATASNIEPKELTKWWQ